MRVGLWVGLAAVVLCAPAGAARGQMVVDAGRGFTFQIPPGFMQLDQLPTPDTLYAFATSDPIGGLPDGAITIERLHGTIGRVGHVVLPSSVPPGATAVVRKWGLADVDVMAANTWVTGEPVVVRCAQIPVPGEAVQINLMLRAGRAAAIDQTLAKVLDGMTLIGVDRSAAGSVTGQISVRRRGAMIARVVGLTLFGAATLFRLGRAWRWMTS